MRLGELTENWSIKRSKNNNTWQIYSGFKSAADAQAYADKNWKSDPLTKDIFPPELMIVQDAVTRKVVQARPSDNDLYNALKATGVNATSVIAAGGTLEWKPTGSGAVVNLLDKSGMVKATAEAPVTNPQRTETNVSATQTKTSSLLENKLVVFSAIGLALLFLFRR